jgi:hypothetical protein
MEGVVFIIALLLDGEFEEGGGDVFDETRRAAAERMSHLKRAFEE